MKFVCLLLYFFDSTLFSDSTWFFLNLVFPISTIKSSINSLSLLILNSDPESDDVFNKSSDRTNLHYKNKMNKLKKQTELNIKPIICFPKNSKFQNKYIQIIYTSIYSCESLLSLVTLY